MKIRIWIGVFLIGSILVLGTWNARGDDDDYGEGSSRVSPVTNVLYAEECGSCHFAYQPGLLPERSWKKMMANLSDHFGDNAELDPQDSRAIEAYLSGNASDSSRRGSSGKLSRSIRASETPLRISETRYIVRKHHEVPKRMISDNPEVRSLSHCDTCHSDAEKGSYDEDRVSIPGFGRWDD
ncbi:MAG TPA: diheme cytochrome c [Nitrospiria bacterium]|nr:diheme cytochrome c [Nitrospiria bacterium]